MIKQKKMKAQIPYNSIARFITGNCSPEEAEKVTAWMESSKENEKLFNQLYEIWENTGALKQEKEFDPINAFKKVKEVIDKKESDKGNVRKLSTSALIRIAAGFLLVAAIGYVFYFMYNAEGKMLVYETSDKKEKIDLSDGSIVWLNKNSKLEYPEKFNGKSREVDLEGEAFFEIARNERKPFIIHTIKTDIKVLGTSFNVLARPELKKTEVLVETGKVRFGLKDNEEKAVELEVGEMGILEEQSVIPEKKPVDDPNLMAWRTGILSFQNTPFKKAIEDIASFYNKDIIFKDTLLFNDSFKLHIDNQPFDFVLNILKMNKDLEVKDSLGTIIIAKK